MLILSGPQLVRAHYSSEACNWPWPLLASLQEWLKAASTKLSRKSETAAAISYALGRWPALLRYCDGGLLEIDNNSPERALRAVALGRKNYLFAGSDAGGERAAALYSLIGCEFPARLREA
jgi:transposase